MKDRTVTTSSKRLKDTKTHHRKKWEGKEECLQITQPPMTGLGSSSSFPHKMTPPRGRFAITPLEATENGNSFSQLPPQRTGEPPDTGHTQYW